METLQTIENWVAGKDYDTLNKVTSDLASFSTETDNLSTVGFFLGQNNSKKESDTKKIFTDPKNLPTAVATILNHSQNRANFHPQIDQSIESFNKYINELDENPFLVLGDNKFNKGEFESKNYDQLVKVAADLLEGASSKDIEEVKNGIKALGKSVFGKETKEQWQNLFSQIIIDGRSEKQPEVSILSVRLHMKYENKKAEVTQQDFVIQRTTFTILPDLISANANLLKELTIKDVDDWISNTSTPVKKGVESCLSL